ncbi:MAG: M15 family metallopeptidase [Rikenellaceae bacterium]|nr:M15 family metallopeptidase [Rikenellaceae bacterium]
MKNATKNLILMLLAVVIQVAVLQGCREQQEQPDPRNPYGLEIVSAIEDYEQMVEADSSNLLVNLEHYIPGIVLDIRYATENNFTGKQIYTSPEAWLRKEAADSLLAIQKALNQEGLGIKVFDAYRPYAATLCFYEVYGDTTFVAAPWSGSIHNRGGAIDLTIISLETGEELEMPTPFDEFSEKASHTYEELPQKVKANREKLYQIMTSHGFTHYQHEWWHYNIKGRNKYALMDISFEELKKQHPS